VELDLVRIPMPSLPGDRRGMFVANAVSLDGLEAARPEHRQAWLDLLGPIRGHWDLDRPFRVWKENGRWRTEGVSTCGLVAEGIWRRMSVDLPELYEPYEVGSAIERAKRYAKQVGAWRTQGRPRPGDYLIVGTKLKTHARTVVDWRDGGETLISVDGGVPGENGLQSIRLRPTSWKKLGSFIISGGRVVMGWIDVESLRFSNNEISVPRSASLVM